MRAAGSWIVVGSVAFWVAWLLMPGVGVTDTMTIFGLVGAHRGSVQVSVVVQLAAAAAHVLGVMALVGTDAARRSRALRAGAGLLALGALGSAADAIFHQVAVEMTAPGVDLAAMVPVMERLQGPDLRLLGPFIAAFFLAHGLLAWTVRRRNVAGRLAWWLLVALPVLGGAAAVARHAGVASGRAVGLILLGILSGSLSLAGVSIARARALLTHGE